MSTVRRIMAQRRQLSTCRILLAKRPEVTVVVSEGLGEVTTRRYRPLQPGPSRGEMKADEEKLLAKQARMNAVEDEARETNGELQTAVDAEIMAPESAPAIHQGAELDTESGLPVLPAVLSRDDTEVIFSLRRAWFESYGPGRDLSNYPRGLEEVFIDACMETGISNAVLYSTLLEAFTADEEGSLPVVHKETDKRGNRCVLLSRSVRFHFDDSYEKGLQPIIFHKRIAVPMLKICNRLLARDNVSMDMSSRHLITRFAARHGFPYDEVMGWLRSMPQSADPTTFNTVLRCFALYCPSWVSRDQLSSLSDEMKRRSIPMTGHSLEPVIRVLAQLDGHKQLLGLCISVAMRQRIVFTPTVWKHVAEAVLFTVTPAKALQFVEALVERMQEEYGDSLVCRLPGYPDENSDQWPEYKRGKLLRALLPPRLTPMLCSTLMDVASQRKEGLDVLHKLMKVQEAMGTANYRSHGAFVNYYCRHGTVQDVMVYVNEVVIPSKVGLQNNIIANIAAKVLADFRQLVRTGKKDVVPGYARDALADLLLLYTDSPKGIKVLDEEEVLIRSQLVRLAVYSDDLGAAVDMLRLLVQAVTVKKELVPVYEIRKVLDMAASRHNWKSAEAIAHMSLQAEVSSRDPSWMKILGTILKAHRSGSDPVDPHSARAGRVLELAMQMVFRGETLTFGDVGEVLRICSARAARSGDALISLQNKSHWPVGISRDVLQMYIPKLPRFFWDEGRNTCTVQQYLAEAKDREEATMKYLLGGEESMRKSARLSDIVTEIIRYSTAKKMTIKDGVVVNLCAFWLTLGKAESLAATMLPILTKASNEQAQLIDAVLEACDTVGGERVRDTFDATKGIEDITNDIRELLASGEKANAA
eukprot:TRINITY_DN4873_c0_g1_i6.p1 TRINITY_DN4873_c0_g1~~TRINITY_DN4873_c0_g1_i6.p1  ORF type:complete len:885 (+),score=198.04 TRINITY_DN4873_c0_g1_i6:44-2656(+)